MKTMNRKHLAASIKSEGLVFLFTALTAALAIAMPIGLLSASRALGNETIAAPLAAKGAAIAVLFLLCGAVQSCFASCQSVAQQRKRIGRQKAQGFTSREILRHYLQKAALCGLAAVLLGLLFAVCVVELPVIALFASGTQPTLAPLPALLLSLACLALFPLSAYAACARLVCLPALELMQAQSPLPAKGQSMFFEASGVCRNMRVLRRMAIGSMLGHPFALISMFTGALLSAGALVLSLSLGHLPFVLLGTGLSFLLFALVAGGQAAAHLARQARTLAFLRAQGCTAKEIRTFITQGPLVVTAAGIALGALCALLTM